MLVLSRTFCRLVDYVAHNDRLAQLRPDISEGTRRMRHDERIRLRLRTDLSERVEVLGHHDELRKIALACLRHGLLQFFESLTTALGDLYHLLTGAFALY